MQEGGYPVPLGQLASRLPFKGVAVQLRRSPLIFFILPAITLHPASS